MKDSDIQPRLQTISEETLAQVNLRYTGTGGVSANNRNQGFIPAFMDTETGNVYRSRFPDGKPAPIHVLAGLPNELLDADRQLNGHRSIKHSVISGFILEDRFYSREAAAQATASGSPH
jgi:hypothetical protein